MPLPQDSSLVHDASQPSPLTLLWSSQTSSTVPPPAIVSTKPLPQV